MRTKPVITSKTRSAQELATVTFDLFLAASGFESRCTNVAMLPFIIARKKIVLRFKEKANTLSREENDAFFHQNDFTPFDLDGDVAGNLTDILDSFCEEHITYPLQILVDYSSMSRTWYAAILRYFRFRHKKTIPVAITFAYSRAKYSKSPDIVPRNSIVEPLEGFMGITDAKPTALFFGMGYTEERAFGLREFFDAEAFAFLASEPDDPDSLCYEKDVIINNQELLGQISPKNIFRYQLRDLDYLEKLLYDLCDSIRSEYRVILAPCGPKPFTLISLVVAMRLDDISVYRISAGKKAEPIQKIADGSVSFFEVGIS